MEYSSFHPMADDPPDSPPERLNKPEIPQSSVKPAQPEDFDGLDTYLEYTDESANKIRGDQSHRSKAGPLAMVETAFLASAASLIWLVNTYFPPGPILRILFPLPMALVYLRWGSRSSWMSALVAGLLLAVLMGPPRSLLFLMPYAVLGVQLGFLWVRQANWYVSVGLGSLVGTIGFFFRVWLMSLLLGEDLWVYLTSQVTQILNWMLEQLISWGLVGLGALGQPNLLAVQILALVMVLISNIIYLFTVHLAAWLLLERLGTAMPAPPDWVQALLDE
jgi:uncharacterized protein YybS (DUF2232 family)